MTHMFSCKMVVDIDHPCEISIRDKYAPITAAKAAREAGIALRLLSDKLVSADDVDTVIDMFREGYTNVAREPVKTKEQV